MLLAALLPLIVLAAGRGGGEADGEGGSPAAAPFDRAFIDTMVRHHRSAAGTTVVPAPGTSRASRLSRRR